MFCVNSPGSYTCGCEMGYTLMPDGKACKGNDAMLVSVLEEMVEMDILQEYTWQFCLVGSGLMPFAKIDKYSI